jgi:hypothetical protein
MVVLNFLLYTSLCIGLLAIIELSDAFPAFGEVNGFS